MAFGITTVRPGEDLEALLPRIDDAGGEAVLVISSDGRLLGVCSAHMAPEVLEHE